MDEGSEDNGPHCIETDTTSHNIVWEPPVLLGDGAGSSLNDVVILSDDPPLVYAVGEVYLRDSTGQIDPIPYAFWSWRGERWTPTRLWYASNGTLLPIRQIRALRVLNASDFWFSAGSIFHWNGNTDVAELKFSRLSLPDPDATIEKLWVSSNSSIYGVGNRGTIVLFDGSSWQQLPSSTSLPIRDIWGAVDPGTGEEEVLAVASGSFSTDGKKLLRIEGTTVTPVSDEGLSWDIRGVWFAPRCRYFVVGSGVHVKRTLASTPWSVFPPGVVTTYGSEGVRGSASNDVFVVGSFMEVVHFNGSTWHNYNDVIPFAEGALGGVAVKGNLVITVGWLGEQAAVLIGRRSHRGS